MLLDLRSGPLKGFWFRVHGLAKLCAFPSGALDQSLCGCPSGYCAVFVGVKAFPMSLLTAIEIGQDDDRQGVQGVHTTG